MKETRQNTAPMNGHSASAEPIVLPAVQNNGHAPQEQHNLDWAWLLWGRRRFLIRWTVRGLIASVVIALLIPKRYESTTRIIPSDNSSAAPMAMMAAMGGGKGSALGMLASNLLSIKDPGGSFIGVLQSDTLEDRLIDRFDLRKVYWDRYMYDARKDLARFTDISMDHKSGIITIAVTDRDPNRAADLGRAYVDELNRMVAELSTSSARRERIFIENRLKVVKQKLDDDARDFSQFASKNTAIDMPSQTKAMVEAGATLQGQLIAAQSELEGLEQIYTPNNVRVRSLQARIGELKHQLAKMGGNSNPPSPDGPKDDELYPPIRQLPLLGVKWADLYRETKIQETVYEMLTQQYEMAKIQEAKEIPTVKILDVAAVPEKKASPPRAVIVIVGALFAFALAATWILGHARWDRMDPLDPRRQLGEEIFARSQARLVSFRMRVGHRWPFRWLLPKNHPAETL
ncbi:MAG TPA: GNVR domain-containing protein [Terriglobales bacterium]|nr:GNVR domain-containing protein [Terriglobales bacterium]